MFSNVWTERECLESVGDVVEDGGCGARSHSQWRIFIDKFYAVFRKIWPNNRLASPMKNPGSTTEEKESRPRHRFSSVIFPLLSF